MSGDIHRIPQRKDLPPELAAIAIPAEDDDPPTVILNANEDDLKAAYKDIRPGVLIPVLLGWLADRIHQWLRNHQAPVAATASAITATGLAVVLHITLNGDDIPIAKPVPTVTTFATPSPSPSSSVDRVTPTAAPSSGRPGPTTNRASAEPPRAQIQPASDSAGEPARDPAPSSRRATPSREPPRSTPSPMRSATPRPEAPQATDEPRPSERQTSTRPTAEPPPRTSESRRTPEPPPQTQSPPATTGRDCVIRVDVDPLLDLCVLS